MHTWPENPRSNGRHEVDKTHLGPYDASGGRAGDGPVIDGAKTVVFVAGLAWARFRVVIGMRDRTAPSVFAALDRTFRILGGAPTYVLTDNENRDGFAYRRSSGAQPGSGSKTSAR